MKNRFLEKNNFCYLFFPKNRPPFYLETVLNGENDLFENKLEVPGQIQFSRLRGVTDTPI